MKIKVIVATHKSYRMPLDNMYLPMHVGAENKKPLDYQGDNIGENISKKNAYYCELTGLYWAWKNLNADYIGLSHYRRHFAINRNRDKWNSIAGREDIEKLLKENSVILPQKRNYFIETTYQQYIHAHNHQDLDKTKEILTEFYPQYLF